MTAGESLLSHATCVTLGTAGVLILGPPGSGKSDLALRLIDEPGHGADTDKPVANLVSDDQVLLSVEDGRLVAAPPDAIAGRLEIRGLGVVPVHHAERAHVVLVVRLQIDGDIERLPDFAVRRVTLLGISIPEFVLNPRHASAAAKVRAAVGAFTRTGFSHGIEEGERA